MDGCGLTRAGADLQGLGNLGSRDGPIHVVERTSVPVSTKFFKLSESVFNGSGRRLPKEDADQIKTKSRQPDSRTKKRAKVAKRAVSEAAATLGIGKSTSACTSPTTSSTAVATTWTSAPDEILTKPIMSSTSTTPSSSDLTSLIYSSFILDHLKSNTNLELNLHKNPFRKFYYPQLISFLDTALSAQPHSYKSLDSVLSSALRFLGF